MRNNLKPFLSGQNSGRRGIRSLLDLRRSQRSEYHNFPLSSPNLFPIILVPTYFSFTHTHARWHTHAYTNTPTPTYTHSSSVVRPSLNVLSQKKRRPRWLKIADLSQKLISTRGRKVLTLSVEKVKFCQPVSLMSFLIILFISRMALELLNSCFFFAVSETGSSE